MVKTFVTSDLHGNLPIITEEFDLLLLCGDVVPAHDHYYSFQKEWVENEFVEWINGLPFKNSWSKIVMTPGNHDMVFERWNEETYKYISKLTNGRLIILRNKEYVFDYLNVDGIEKQLKIFGTPYCQIFGNWAFMRTNGTLKKKFDEIPYNIDVLISHSSPDIEEYGCIHYKPNKIYKNAGCPILAKAIKEKKPKYVFCGHIHSGNHELQVIDGTAIANVSCVDESYKFRDNMLKLYIEGHERE